VKTRIRRGLQQLRRAFQTCSCRPFHGQVH
jgi:hypothetical protein